MGGDYWVFNGTRAQLEAEDVIPPNTTWPELDDELYFDVGRFRYSLGRSRPVGLKGPKKAWISGDWWHLRCNLIDGPGIAAIRILDQERELGEARYHQTTDGQREQNANFIRYWKAHEDKAFQAFKAVFVPQRKKPNHKRQSGNDGDRR